jgi:hypothetical protein
MWGKCAVPGEPCQLELEQRSACSADGNTPGSGCWTRTAKRRADAHTSSLTDPIPAWRQVGREVIVSRRVAGTMRCSVVLSGVRSTSRARHHVVSSEGITGVACCPAYPAGQLFSQHLGTDRVMVCTEASLLSRSPLAFMGCLVGTAACPFGDEDAAGFDARSLHCLSPGRCSLGVAITNPLASSAEGSGCGVVTRTAERRPRLPWARCCPASLRARLLAPRFMVRAPRRPAHR